MSADALTPATSPSPRLVAGRYRLGARRGSSIDAALFEAVDEELGRPVVVKLVHPETSARPEVQADFREKMEQAGAIHHPNIAVAHSWGITDWKGNRVLFVVSEQLTGGSVRDMLDRGRLLTPSQALLVGLDACKALDQLHRRGLVHGDIRPGTLVFGDDRRLRVVDPGLSQVLAIADDNVHRSNDLAKYASPEQAQGGAIEARSDVYSLCLTLFETLTGTVPFVGDSTVATLANRVDRLLPVSADLGPLATVLERAGRPNPGERFTAAEFARALLQAAERLPRPEPLPILANSLFGADPGDSGDLTDPTGVLLPPTMAVPVVAAVVPVGAPVEPEPLLVVPVDAPVEPDPAPVAAVPAPPPPLPAIETGTDDEIDPRDEFPEAPPTPGRTRKRLVLLLLLLAIAGGALAWYNARPEMRTVPALAGMEEGVALNAVAGDFEAVAAQESSEDVGAGLVIRTDPVPGIELEKGSALTLFISTGPAPRVLPELAGLTVAAATAELEGLGLVAEVGDPAFDETVPVDTVLSWTVPDSPSLVAGGTVVKGTTVRLVASAGPAPRAVPDLTGQTLDAATASLAAVQLTITQTGEEFSDTIAAGQVMRQDPAPGASAARDSNVNVVLSKGRAPIKVPVFTDPAPAAVRAALEKAGFVVAAVEGDPTKAFIGLRVGSDPARSGQEFPYGTQVVLLYALL
jgi:serine/threonine-protein kinase